MKIRALLLTAGFGVRLRPLTLFMPKPLLPVCGTAVASYSLESLSRAGCEAAVLNLHYLGDMIREFFGDDYHGLPLEYSLEKDLRGTLGALSPVGQFLAGADVILLANGDTLCDWPWLPMIEAHLSSGSEATLLLHERLPEERLGGPVGVDGDGFVVQLRDSPRVGEVKRRHLFAGAHVISPSLLERVGDRSGDIVEDLYIPLLQRGGRIHSLVTSAFWHDLGTPGRLLRANIEAREQCRELAGWTHPVSSGANIDGTAAVGNTTILEGAAVQEASNVEDSVIFQNAVVGPTCHVRSSILGPGVHIPAGSRVERQLVTRAKAGYEVVDTGDSQMSGLLYSSLSLD